MRFGTSEHNPFTKFESFSNGDCGAAWGMGPWPSLGGGSSPLAAAPSRAAGYCTVEKSEGHQAGLGAQRGVAGPGFCLDRRKYAPKTCEIRGIYKKAYQGYVFYRGKRRQTKEEPTSTIFPSEVAYFGGVGISRRQEFRPQN